MASNSSKQSGGTPPPPPPPPSNTGGQPRGGAPSTYNLDRWASTSDDFYITGNSPPRGYIPQSAHLAAWEQGFKNAGRIRT